MKCLLATAALCILLAATMANAGPTFYLAKYNNSVDYPAYPGCQVASLGDYNSKAFRDQYNSNFGLSKLGSIDTATNCAIMVKRSNTSEHIGALGSPFHYFGTYFTNGTGFCFGDYPEKMLLGNWPSTTSPFFSLSSSFTAEGQVANKFGPTWSGPTTALVRCDSKQTVAAEKKPLHSLSSLRRGSTAHQVPVANDGTNATATYYIGQYNVTYPMAGCRIATLEEFQSKELREQYNSAQHLPRLGQLEEEYLNCAVMAQDTMTGNVGCLRDEFFYQSYSADKTGFGDWVCGKPYGNGYPSEMKLGGWKRSHTVFGQLTKDKQMGTWVDYKTFPPKMAGPTIALIRCSNSNQ